MAFELKMTVAAHTSLNSVRVKEFGASLQYIRFQVSYRTNSSRAGDKILLGAQTTIFAH